MASLLKKIAIRIMVYLLICLGVLWLFVKHLEKTNIFYPYKSLTLTPSDVGLIFEDVDLKTSDGLILKSWLVRSGQESPYVLLCHGNAGNLSSRVDKVKLLHEAGANVFIFDYRGFGKSQGKPTEKGVYRDTSAAYEYLLSRNVPAEKIIVYGESLGGSAAVELASKKAVAGLILEGAFTSTRDMGKVLYPALPSFLVSDSFNSLKKIKSVRVPVLCMHTIDDHVVPFRIGKKLYDAVTSLKRFVELSGTHNDAFLDSKETYLNALESFLKQVDQQKER